MVTFSDMGASTPFRVGDWVVDPDSGHMHRGDTDVKLEPKVMQVLVLLAQQQGKVVSREALEASVWAGMVVGYDAIAGSIIKLRKALGDNSRNPRYIETVSKKGYRLIAPVTEVAGEAHVSVSSHPAPLMPTSAGNHKIRTLVMAGLGLVVVTGLLLFLSSRIDKPIQPTPVEVPATTKMPSVVVLPFTNLSDDPRQGYISDGITGDLITELSKVGSVRVIARQSSDYYKSNPATLEDIARQLDVLYIVEGSVQKSGNRIRVNVQLTNTEAGESIWGERFDTYTSNIFDVQDEITRSVIDAMYVTLSGKEDEHIAAHTTKNFKAYDAFLAGQQHIKKRSKQANDLAMNAYQRAIEIDPNYARSYGAMAVALTRGYRNQWTDLSLVEARERALKLAKKAVALNQSTPQIYWSLGYVHVHRREFDAAEVAARQSIALSPNYADGYALIAYIANWRGKADEAVSHIKKAAELNPYHTFEYSSILGVAYYNLGRYEEAVTALHEALDRNKSAFNPRLFLAAAYVRLDRMEEAAWEIEQINVSRPDATVSNLSTILPYEHKRLLLPLLGDLRKAGLPE